MNNQFKIINLYTCALSYISILNICPNTCIKKLHLNLKNNKAK